MDRQSRPPLRPDLATRSAQLAACWSHLWTSISRQQAWEIARAASELANVRVLALRASQYGVAGEPAPVHPHLFRHARVRQIVGTTKSLPIAQKQAGRSRLQMAYLSVSDDEVRMAMRDVDARRRPSTTNPGEEAWD